MRHEDIAVAIGICRDTLAKHFELELSAGAAARRMEVLGALYLAAKRGSSSAAKAFLAADPTLGVPPLSDPAKPAGQPEVVKAPTKGKKEQAQADAIAAAVGTDWESLLGSARAKLQ